MLQQFTFCAVEYNRNFAKADYYNYAYVNGEVKESSHPLHCDSGVIFGHYSYVLGGKIFS